MIRKSLVLTLAIILFGIILFSSDCGSGPQNQNTNAQNNSVANNNPTGPKPCDSSTIDTKVREIQGAIDNEITGDVGANGLNSQVNVNGGFTANVSKHLFNTQANQTTPNETIQITFRGTITGDDKFKKLYDIFSKHVNKGCVERLVFEPAATANTAAVRGFVSQPQCEDPEKPCPGGYCSTGCKKDGNGNSGGNGNADSRSKSNPSSNSNSNSNGGTNSNSNGGKKNGLRKSG